jgi:NAD(P)-dependent dehydrogenase (short-subunit alcohol dehydrogenase family)
LKSPVFSLTNKKILVTGGSSGIGLAVARQYYRAGAEVAICARHRRAGLGELDAHFMSCDQGDENQVKTILQNFSEKFGELDVLVINAGVIDEGMSLESLDLGELEAMWRINSLGVANFLKHGPTVMRDGGSIIITATPAAEMTFPGYIAYGVSKSSIPALVKYAAMELGPRLIRVNSVSPGTIVTDMQPDDDAEARISQITTCLGRLGTVDDLIGIYHFLAADESSFVTAANIAVDGGWLGGLTSAAFEKLLTH